MSHNFFSTLGVAPVAGRSFLPAEDLPNPPRVAVASWGLWQRLGGKHEFLGSKIVLNGEPYTVVGILPKGFEFLIDQIDVWMPYQMWPPYRPGRAGGIAQAVGRLRPGVTLAAAREELNAQARDLAQQFSDTNRDRTSAVVMPLREIFTDNLRPQLLVLAGAVLLALLVACANIATLTVSRVISRGRELGIRAALGAGRARLMAHLVSEQLLLSLGGAALGLLLADWFTRLPALSNQLPPLMMPCVDWRVALIGLALAVLAALFTAPLPALSLLRGRTLDVSSGGRSSETLTANRMRQVLVTLSVAVSVVLLAGAGLLVRSFNALSGVDPGFRPDHLLTLEYRMPQTKYPKPEQQADFHHRVVEEAAALPGVRAASIMFGLPFSGNSHFQRYEIAGRPPEPKGSEPHAQVNRVSARYFETMGIPLLRGRVFGAADQLGARRVAILSKSMAERCWPGEDPLHRQIRPFYEAGPEPFTVVGVVGDSKHDSLEEESRDKVYVPFAQYPHIFGALAIRTEGNPMNYAHAIRTAVWRVDKDQPVWKVRTMESLIDNSVSNRRALAALMEAFSGFALLLAAVGLYGVVSYSVTRRRKEFGIRAAMGATPAGLLKLALRQGMRNVTIGMAVGLACAIPASILLRKQLFQVRTSDPEAYVAAVLAIFAAAFVATVLPARRVFKISPSDVLRQE